MQLITITTDLGTRDFYLPALKGALHKYCGSVTLVDVNTNVKPYDLKEAAFNLRSAFPYFPDGSVHIAHVAGSDGEGRILVSKVRNHSFILFDNGLLSLLFGRIPDDTFILNDELMAGSNLLYTAPIAKAAQLLLMNTPPPSFTQPATEARQLRHLQPMLNGNVIRASVVYIDQFGNAITNITREIFEHHTAGKSYTISINMAEATTVSTHYNEVEEGDFVCFFNSLSLLEIAICKGKAGSLLGVKLESTVLVTVGQ